MAGNAIFVVKLQTICERWPLNFRIKTWSFWTLKATICMLKNLQLVSQKLVHPTKYIQTVVHKTVEKKVGLIFHQLEAGGWYVFWVTPTTASFFRRREKLFAVRTTPRVCNNSHLARLFCRHDARKWAKQLQSKHSVDTIHEPES